MKLGIRVLSLILALLMLAACLLACKKDGDETDDVAAATTTVSSGDDSSADSDAYLSKLPSMDWGEAVFMVLGNDGSFHQLSQEIARDEMPDDTVGKAVYERNDILRQKYNFTVDETLVRRTVEEMELRYNAGDDLYDAVMYCAEDAAQHAMEGYFLDLNQVPYINLDHHAWNQYATEQLTIAGKTYFTISDFLITDKERFFLMHYNRDMAIQAGKGYLEDMVTNNTWTFDNFNAIVTEFTGDGNGNGKTGEMEDNYGVAAESVGTYGIFLYGGGFRLSHNVDGNIVMAGAGKDITKIIDDSEKWALKNNVVYYPDKFHQQHPTGNAYGTETEMFLEQRSLFLSGFLQGLEELRAKATFERAYMPYPKYDDKQEHYYTVINDYSHTICIPYTVGNTEKAGFMLQAITEESTKTSYYAYFEEKCKLQDSVDQRAVDTLEIIFEHVVFDVAYIYNLADFQTCLNTMAKSGVGSRYNREYIGRAGLAEERIQEIIEKYSGDFVA